MGQVEFLKLWKFWKFLQKQSDFKNDLQNQAFENGEHVKYQCILQTVSSVCKWVHFFFALLLELWATF